MSKRSIALRPLKDLYTRQEYLAMEEVAPYKSEYHNGKIYMMAGGTADHSLIKVDTITELRQRLRGTACHVFDSDMRLLIESEDLYTYPDAMVVCGENKFETKSETTLVNPLLIIEVLSESTRQYDQTDKFAFYKKIPTFQEYLVIESAEPKIVVHRRALGRKWVVEHFDGLDAVVRLQSVNLTIPARQIYEQASWYK